MGKLQDIIYVRDCNSVNGCLPVSSEPNGVFKEVKYIRADLAQPAPASDAVQRAISYAEDQKSDFEFLIKKYWSDKNLKSRNDCQVYKDMLLIWETILAALRSYS